MTTIKRVTILYFSSLFAFIIISKLFGGQTILILQSLGFWILPLFVILVGQIVGFVATLIFGNPLLKQKIFNVSFIISFIGFATIISLSKYSNWRHRKDFGNIEANQDYFKYFAGDYVIEEKIAFDSLSKLLVDSNSFRITGTSVKAIDTTVNGHAETTYFTTFHYRKESQKLHFKAQFAVLQNIARLIYFDIPFDQNDYHQIDSFHKVVRNSVKESMKVVPDSIKDKIKKDFQDIIDE